MEQSRILLNTHKKTLFFITVSGFSFAFLLVTAFALSTFYDDSPSAWESDKGPGRERLVDGEGEPYRSTKFEVRRPSATPYPDLVGFGKYAYFIDGPGRHVEQLTEHLYDEAWIFSEELGAVKQDGSWGYIDRSGDYVIQPRFEWAEPFSEGLAAVKYKGCYGFIDRSGAFVIDPQFLVARYFSIGLAPAKTEDGWLYIDQDGNTVIAGPFEMAESFSTAAELAAVRVDGKWGYIDNEGSMIIAPRFDEAWAFAVQNTSLGAAVKIDGEWLYIDSAGRMKQ